MIRLALCMFLFGASGASAATCALDPAAAPEKPRFFQAKVLGPASDDDVLSQTKIAIARVHAPVSPGYVNLPRILAVFKDGGGEHKTIAAVTSGPVPAAGVIVTLATRYRDPKLPCAFIPWTVRQIGETT